MAGQRRWYGGIGKTARWGALAAVAAGGLAAVAVPAGAASAATVSVPTRTVSFTTVGEHPFTVPLGVTSVQVTAIGGAGGGGYSPGGLGAEVKASVAVTPGSTIYAEVAGNGAGADLTENQPAAGGANGGEPGGAWNGGSLAKQLGVLPASGAGGGGASGLQACPVASCQPIDTGASTLLLLAGGGGGGGSSYGPANATYSVVTQAPSVTITYQVAFLLAPASNDSLVLDGATGYITQQVPDGASSQLWELVPVGSLYQIVNLSDNDCLTTSGTAGAQLFIWFCTSTSQDLWQLPADFGAGFFGSPIENPASGLYIDVFGGSTTAGGAIDA